MAERPTIPSLLNGVHEFFRRHWRRALIIRDQLRLSEEAFHLLLAAAIGIIGALTNLAYHTVSQLTKWLVLSRTGDLVEIAEALAPWQRLLVPTLGGLAAGLVLYLGLRLISNPGLSNLLEAVVAGDGRLLLRPALTNPLPSLIRIHTAAPIRPAG